jgi:hypothetical protein
MPSYLEKSPFETIKNFFSFFSQGKTLIASHKYEGLSDLEIRRINDRSQDALNAAWKDTLGIKPK